MRRILPDENSVTDPDTGVQVFKEPNPPDEDSILSPEYINGIQEEICSVIEGAGITLNVLKRDQLRDAIKTNHAILVDTTFGIEAGLDLHEIYDLIKGRYIAPGKTVTIDLFQMDDRELKKPFVMDHPQSAQIILQGFESDPSDSILTFNSTTGNFPVGCKIMSAAAGCTLNLRSVYLNRLGTATACDGISAQPGGIVKAYKTRVQGLKGNAYSAGFGASLYLDQCTALTLTSASSLDDGYTVDGHALFSTRGGFIQANNFYISDPISRVAFAYKGGRIELSSSEVASGYLLAARNGVMTGSLVNVTGAGEAAFSAEEKGQMFLINCKAGASGTPCSIGFSAYKGGYIMAENCEATNCSSLAFSASDYGVMDLDSCQGLNRGVQADSFGVIKGLGVTVSQATNILSYGFRATNGGGLDLRLCSSTWTAAGGHGYYADRGGKISANQCTAVQLTNVGNGFYAFQGGKILTNGNCAVTNPGTSGSYVALNHSYILKGASSYSGSAGPSPAAGSNDTTLSRID